MSSENKDNYISSFSIKIYFISFYYLTALARTSSAMSVRADILVLFLILGEDIVFHH